jgi:hypothetical protein
MKAPANSKSKSRTARVDATPGLWNKTMPREYAHSDHTSYIRSSSGQAPVLLQQTENLCAERNLCFTELLDLSRPATSPRGSSALHYPLQQGLAHRHTVSITCLACDHQRHSHAALFPVSMRCEENPHG